MSVLIKIRLVILVIFCASAGSVVGAPEPLQWYQVEVIVFEQLRTVGILQETWPDDPGYPKVDEASLLIPTAAFGTVRPFLGGLFPDPGKSGNRPNTAPGAALDSAINDALGRGATTSDANVRPDTPFVQLDARAFKLSTAAQRLSNSGRYRVLAHTAWRQPIQKGAEPVLVRLYSGEDDWRVYLETLRQQRQRIQSIGGSLPPVSDVGQGFARNSSSQVVFSNSDGALGPPPLHTPLDGTIGVRLSRYLHLEVDLILQKRVALPRPASDGNLGGKDDLIVITEDGGRVLSDVNTSSSLSNDPDLHRFRLTESRRMRSKEVHLYDHPALGIIATIIPYDPKKTSPSDSLEPGTSLPEPDGREEPPR